MIAVFALYNVLCNWSFLLLWLSLTLIENSLTYQFLNYSLAARVN